MVQVKVRCTLSHNSPVKNHVKIKGAIKKGVDILTIKDKVVVITGASSGIGRATAEKLAQSGAKVVIGARRVDRLRAIADQFPSGKCAVPKKPIILIEAALPVWLS